MTSDSSSDDEFIQDLVEMLPRERQLRIRQHPMDIYNDVEFKMRYRFPKMIVGNILEIIGPALEPVDQRNLPVSALDKLLITLRFYATGAFQMVLADHINVSPATICRVIHNVSAKLAELRPNYIKMPVTVEAQARTKSQFQEIAEFPGDIGCIDCSHIRVQSPGGDNFELFRNRKGFFSINVQAVCDAKLRICDIVARWPRSVHDSTIFNDSSLKAEIEMGNFGNSYLLGDSGYACKSYLLMPLLNPQTRSEIAYNDAHIRTRNIVERLFGVWKRRFPCLSVGMRTKIERTLVIIIATAVLHNMAVDLHDEVPNEDEAIIIPEIIYEPVPVIVANGQRNDAVRTALINTYFGR